MDYKTKTYYRNKIKEISKRTKISELYITQKALELARSNANAVGSGALVDPQTEIKSNTNSVGVDALIDPQTKNQPNVTTNKKNHIGYYLIAEGINELYKALQTNKKPKKEKRSVPLYILSITLITILISGLISYYIFKQTNLFLGAIIFLLSIIPSSQIATDIIQYILNKIVKPSLIPKMDFSSRNTQRMCHYGYNT